MAFLTQNGGNPVSQSSIILDDPIMCVCTQKKKLRFISVRLHCRSVFSIIPKKNSRNIKNRRELAVLLQSETPELEAGDWVRGFEPTFSRFLEVTGDVIVGNCLKLKLF